MREYLKYNLQSYLLNQTKREHILLSFLIIIVFALLCFSCSYEFYNITHVNAEMICEEENCSVTFYWQTLTSPFVYDCIKINNEKVDIEKVDFEDMMLDSSNIAYQKITLKVKEFKGNNKEIVKLQIYQNKEKIIKQIIKMM